MSATVAIAEELLTESQAVRRVPGADAAVRAWLRSLGIARKGPTGLTLYRLSEILAHLPLANEPVEEAQPRHQVIRLRKSAAI